MSEPIHVVTAAVVKVSIGANGGNRVARFVQRGDLVPAGVDAEQIDRLIARGLIAEQHVEETEVVEVAVEPVATEKAAATKPAVK